MRADPGMRTRSSPSSRPASFNRVRALFIVLVLAVGVTAATVEWHQWQPGQA